MSKKIVINILRILTGLVFIFSSVVKGVDPLGTAYKIEDYLIAYHISGLTPAALLFSVLLCTLEFTVGIMLLLKLRMRFTAWVLAGIMAFFTLVTLYDALYSPVPDCGCFGDFLKITNWQTFYKNIVIDAFVVVIFINRNNYKEYFSIKTQWIIAWAFAVLFALFCVRNYRHLPAIDFSEYKTGNKLYIDNPKPVECYLTYQNKDTKEKKEYLSPNYPFDDSVWMEKWQFVSQRIVDPNQYPGKNLVIVDTIGNNITYSVIRNKDYQYIINIYDLEKVNIEALKKLDALAKELEQKNNISTIVLAAGDEHKFTEFKAKYNISLPFYSGDDVILKIMVRSNPGLMIIKDGEVLKKYHYRDIPSYDKLNQWMKKQQ